MPIGKTRGESRTIALMEKRAHILVVDDEQAIADLKDCHRNVHMLEH